MAPVRALLLALVAAAAALSLAGCGGSDEPPSTGATTGVNGDEAAAEERGQKAGAEGVGDEEQIEGVIAAVLTSVEAREVCDEAVTPAFLKRAYGDRAGCAALLDAAGAQARAVEVRRLEIDGDAATAAVRPDGGIYDAERLDATLVRKGDAWKVDRLDADIPVGP